MRLCCFTKKSSVAKSGVNDTDTVKRDDTLSDFTPCLVARGLSCFTAWLVARRVAAARSRVCYRGTSLIRKRPPPRTTRGPSAWAYCRVLGEGVFV